MKNREPSSLKILYLAAFHFKEERVLAAHLVSYHPRKVFGCLENGKKMREIERKWKRQEKLKASAPKNLLLK